MTDRKKVRNSGTQTLFQSPLLEKLSRTHAAIPISIFCAYAAVLLWWSVVSTSLSALYTIALFVSGLLVFTWVEYQVHRHVFHMSTFTVWRAKWQYIIHGVHHEFPKDKDRLAMPPLLSVSLATLLYLIFHLILGQMALSFLAGFLLGYAAYLLVHYMIHVFQPPRNFLRTLWINHAKHHYRNGEAAFGVSSPLWDYVYGTLDDPSALQRVPSPVQSD